MSEDDSPRDNMEVDSGDQQMREVSLDATAKTDSVPPPEPNDATSDTPKAVFTDSEACESLRRLATTKLTCSAREVLFDDANKALKLAALSSRLHPVLNYFRHTTHSLVKEMVASHMATLISVPEHRQAFYSTYPPEPILADAAARLLHDWKRGMEEDDATPITTILRDALVSQVLDIGEAAEIVCRCLLTMARDDACLAKYEDVRTHPISVETFIKSFLNKTWADDFIERIDKDATEHGRVNILKSSINFTHWVRWKGPVSPEAIRWCFITSAAIIGKRNQRGWDLLIPICLNPDGDLSDPKNYSIVAAQIKSHSIRSEKDRKAIMEKIVDEVEKGQEGKSIMGPSDKGRPYIAITMGLEHSQMLNEKKKPSERYIFEFEQQDQNLRTGGHTVYGLTICGCDRDAYPVLTKGDKKNLAEILATDHDLASEHPRKRDKEAMEIVRRQKATITNELIPTVRPKSHQ